MKNAQWFYALHILCVYGRSIDPLPHYTTMIDYCGRVGKARKDQKDIDFRHRHLFNDVYYSVVDHGLVCALGRLSIDPPSVRSRSDPLLNGIPPPSLHLQLPLYFLTLNVIFNNQTCFLFHQTNTAVFDRYQILCYQIFDLQNSLNPLNNISENLSNSIFREFGGLKKS